MNGATNLFRIYLLLMAWFRFRQRVSRLLRHTIQTPISVFVEYRVLSFSVMQIMSGNRFTSIISSDSHVHLLVLIQRNRKIYKLNVLTNTHTVYRSTYCRPPTGKGWQICVFCTYWIRIYMYIIQELCNLTRISIQNMKSKLFKCIRQVRPILRIYTCQVYQEKYRPIITNESVGPKRFVIIWGSTFLQFIILSRK